jgi:quercetin dioxygenase-like cupin family protein
VLILRGEAGVGKTALLEYLVAKASGCRVARAAGIESEKELAFAGLHQLCAPMLGELEHLPGPQCDALSTAFGLRARAAADRFLVGLAVLTLLSQVADERSLVCVVDDAHWLDQASAQVLGFVARRLLAESVALVFAVRDPSEDPGLGNLPIMVIGGGRMRIPNIPMLGWLSVLLCSAAGRVSAQDAKVTKLMTKELPDIPGKEALMITVEYPPGGKDPVHGHNAHAFVYVLEGSVVMQLKGGKADTLTAGQTFYEGPNDIHVVGQSAGSTKPAKILVLLLKKKGAPALVPVSE